MRDLHQAAWPFGASAMIKRLICASVALSILPLISAAEVPEPTADELEWRLIGPALAQGWFDPLPTPACTALTVRTWTDGKMANYQGTGGIVRAEYYLEIDGGGSIDGAQAYVESHIPGFGYALGRYVNNPSNHVITPPLLVTEKGMRISSSIAKKKAKKKFNVRQAKLTVTPLSAVARQPLDGARFADNTPVFSWYTEEPLGCIVELCRDPAFPLSSVKSQSSNPGIPWLAWSKPLAPGKWYWRLRTACGFIGDVRSFVQTAPASADCVPPEICAAPRAMSGRNQIYGFRVEGGDVARVSADLDGKALRAAFGGERAGVKPPPEGWPRGVKPLVLTAVDRHGNASTSLVYIACNPDIPVVRWGGCGESATIGARPFEPRGLYGVGTLRETPDNTNEFAMAKRCGFNFVHSYGRDTPPASPQMLKRFDEMESFGLKTMISFSRADVRRQRYDLIAQKMDALIDHPALLAWYLSDEPDSQLPMPVPEAVFRRFNRFVKALDPAHPTLLSFCMPRSLRRYDDCCDVHLTQAYQKGLPDVRKHLESVSADIAALPSQMRHTGIVNVRTSKDAADFLEKIECARRNGCGFMVYALFEALRQPQVRARLEEALLNAPVGRAGKQAGADCDGE